jgi:hypothetical protein
MKGMVELARTAWALVSLALVAVFVWALMVLPERVPQKLDGAGSVTEWGSRTGFLVALAVGMVTTVGLGPLARGISRTMSLDLVNVPHKERWLPAHEGALRERVATDLYAVSAGVGGLLTGIHAGLVAVALGEPRSPTWAVGIAVVAGLALTAQIIAMLTFRYRAPD